MSIIRSYFLLFTVSFYEAKKNRFIKRMPFPSGLESARIAIPTFTTYFSDLFTKFAVKFNFDEQYQNYKAI